MLAYIAQKCGASLILFIEDVDFSSLSNPPCVDILHVMDTGLLLFGGYYE